MYQANVISDKKILERELNSDLFRVYSCLNAFTLNLLLKTDKYDSILEKKHSVFVVDGTLAWLRFVKSGYRVRRVCGRELLNAALKSDYNKLVVIGGSDDRAVKTKLAFDLFFGSTYLHLIPPYLKTLDELNKFADDISTGIPNGSLVVIFIRSPFQDVLSDLLAKSTINTKFINVGAVIDDIVGGNKKIIIYASMLRLEWLYRLCVSPKRTFSKILGSICLRLKITSNKMRWHVL